MISMKYAGALATIEIGTTVDIENELVIIGSNGRVTIPNDWWNTGYFEANISGKEFLKGTALTSRKWFPLSAAGADDHDQRQTDRMYPAFL